jgi:hypothetical protein
VLQETGSNMYAKNLSSWICNGWPPGVVVPDRENASAALPSGVRPVAALYRRYPPPGRRAKVLTGGGAVSVHV